MSLQISIPCGRTHLYADLPGGRLNGVLPSRLENRVPALDETELVEAALRAPIGSDTPEGISTIIS